MVFPSFDRRGDDQGTFAVISALDSACVNALDWEERALRQNF